MHELTLQCTHARETARLCRAAQLSAWSFSRRPRRFVPSSLQFVSSLSLPAFGCRSPLLLRSALFLLRRYRAEVDSAPAPALIFARTRSPNRRAAPWGIQTFGRTEKAGLSRSRRALCIECEVSRRGIDETRGERRHGFPYAPLTFSGRVEPTSAPESLNIYTRCLRLDNEWLPTRARRGTRLSNSL